MATTTQHPSSGDPKAAPTTQAGIPFHKTPTNYIDAQNASSTRAQPNRIPDAPSWTILTQPSDSDDNDDDMDEDEHMISGDEENNEGDEEDEED